MVSVAVVGATGMVGRAVLEILVERGFPCKDMIALASPRHPGRQMTLENGFTLPVQVADTFDFRAVDLAFFCAGSAVSKKLVPKALEAGVCVIDKASLFRMDPTVPLIVPEVNAHHLDALTEKRLVTSPNCTTIPLVMVLKALQGLAPLSQVTVSTYQSVSGAGKAGMDELYHQTKGVFVNEDTPGTVFPKPIAFNVIPLIGAIEKNGFSQEENKMMQETEKILEGVKISATCVRVPVFIGHSQSVHVRFEKAVTVKQAREALIAQTGIMLIDRPADDHVATPIAYAGEDNVYLSRLRQDPFDDQSFSLWIVADNVRKGAALNAVQIAETLRQKKII
jgi:aspartate-semialdehyde dehydrogenase